MTSITLLCGKEDDAQFERKLDLGSFGFRMVL